MIVSLECKKLKRTGFKAAFFGGGILAAAVPALNMAFRSEAYLSMDAPPVKILLNANWQMMAMLNVLLIVAGACILYHIEYADHAIRKMRTLPFSESAVFFGKTAVLVSACILLLAIEAASIFGCSVHWFGPAAGLYREILKNFGFFLLLMLPAILLSLAAASVCRNMWTALGTGVVCVFAATMIPAQNFALSLFPFALPFRTFSDLSGSAARNYAIAGAAETVGAAALAILILKIRRSFE